MRKYLYDFVCRRTSPFANVNEEFEKTLAGLWFSAHGPYATFYQFHRKQENFAAAPAGGTS